MVSAAADLAARLARDAEAVCRHYLPNGKREGRYWLVGDVANTPGRSLFVRLSGPERGKGAAGKWSDAATGQYGDLLDLIALNLGLERLSTTLAEARRFLGVSSFDHATAHSKTSAQPFRDTSESARRLYAASRPITGTLAETYLRTRGITAIPQSGPLRFHPHCHYRDGPNETFAAWPAVIAAVTDLDGAITGVHRTWLDPAGLAKAPVETPRRALGELIGHGVRFGLAREVLAAGEGIETMLSLRSLMPAMPMIAALSAHHLAVIVFPKGLRRLYIARDRDPAGDAAVARLTGRAYAAGIEARTLSPLCGDFNDDLTLLGVDALRAALPPQLAPEDVARFLTECQPA